MFDAESIKGREQSSKELLRNAFDALICTSEKLDFQKKSYELFGFNIAAFHHGTKDSVLMDRRLGQHDFPGIIYDAGNKVCVILLKM